VKKLGIIALTMALLNPALPLGLVGLLANPAANCAASDLTITVTLDHLQATTADGVAVSLDKTQLARAATIITIGAHTAGVTRDAIIIALMAALTESRLRNLANTTAYPETANYTHDGDGSDHDSLGLFQMRHQTGWGTIAQLMDPTYQTRAFYGGKTGPNHGTPRGLLDILDWPTLTLGQVAQAVEISAYPNRYELWQPVAQTILDALTRPGGPRLDQTPPDVSQVVFPLPSGTWVMASPYGWRIHPVTGQNTFHAGTDYAAPDGTPIMAVADGIVTYAGPLGGYGHAIDIAHTIDGQLVTSRYGHMWEGHLYVAEGEQVLAGQHIGDVGSDGISTGPHLHLEIHLTLGTTNPAIWLNQHQAAQLDQPVLSAAGCYT